VEIKIYNGLGEEITTLINEFKNSGKYRIIYNTPGLSSGVYFCRMKAGDVVLTKKMILLR
jgi:hypothetical protein